MVAELDISEGTKRLEELIDKSLEVDEYGAKYEIQMTGVETRLLRTKGTQPMKGFHNRNGEAVVAWLQDNRYLAGNRVELLGSKTRFRGWNTLTVEFYQDDTLLTTVNLQQVKAYPR